MINLALNRNIESLLNNRKRAPLQSRVEQGIQNRSPKQINQLGNSIKYDLKSRHCPPNYVCTFVGMVLHTDERYGVVASRFGEHLLLADTSRPTL